MINKSSRKRIKKRKRIGKRKVFFRLLIISLIIFGIYLLVNKNNYKDHKTVFPTLGIYKESVDTKGYNFYDEKLFSSKGSGIVVYNAYEGQKVPVNFNIANVNLMQDVSSLKDELIKVQAAIDYKNNVEKPSEKDYKISDTQVSIIRNIQKFIKGKDYSNLILSINNLDLNTKHSVSISELSELLSLDIEQLEEKKKDLSYQVSTNDVEYKAEYSGIVSMEFDNLEDFYNFNISLDTYTAKYLEKNSTVQTSKIKINVTEGDRIFKLIDNMFWYMAVPVYDVNFAKNINRGDELTIIIGDEQELKGKVIEINPSPESSVFILKFEDKIMDFYLHRINNISLIKQMEDALIIPASAIVEKEGVVGVYVQEIHGLLKFIPINILREKDKEAYIERGNVKGLIKVGNKEQKTLTINDAIVIEPTLVENEQVIN